MHVTLFCFNTQFLFLVIGFNYHFHRRPFFILTANTLDNSQNLEATQLPDSR